MANSLLILTQYFPPEMGAPQARLSEIALNLKEYGWNVEILTALPNYPKGKVFDGYKGKKFCVDDYFGIKVIRTFIIPTKSPNAVKRLICYFSFVISSSFYGKKFCKKPSLIYVESPPLFLYYSALFLSKYFKAPYVLNLSDLWPDVFLTLGKLKTTSIFYKLMKILEKKAYEKATGITCQTKGILKAVDKIVPNKKKILIPNGIEGEKFGKNYYSKDLRENLGWNEKFVFVYAGLFGVSQGLEQIIKVAETLKNEEEIMFSLIGDGPEKEKIENLLKEKHLLNVQILPMQPKEKIPSMLASADAAIIPLAVNIEEAVPSKVYEAMGSQLPVLVISEGEVSKLVKEANAGVVCPPYDIEKIKEGVLKIKNMKECLKEMGERGRDFVLKNYDRKKISKNLSDFLRDLIL